MRVRRRRRRGEARPLLRPRSADADEDPDAPGAPAGRVAADDRRRAVGGEVDAAPEAASAVRRLEPRLLAPGPAGAYEDPRRARDPVERAADDRGVAASRDRDAVAERPAGRVRRRQLRALLRPDLARAAVDTSGAGAVLRRPEDRRCAVGGEGAAPAEAAEGGVARCRDDDARNGEGTRGVGRIGERRRREQEQSRRYGAGDEAPGYAAARAPESSSCAIWIAFSAAPLRRLSLARKSARPFSVVVSWRIRPTRTSSMPCGLARGRELVELHRRGGLEQRAGALGGERLLGLDPDRLGVADHDRHADARGLDRQVGQLHDLAGLGAELRLLVELLAVEVPVHAQVVLVGRLAAQALHRLRAGARDRLVGRDAHAREAGLLVQRLEHARERDRAAVRVRDDARRSRARGRR